MNKLRTILATVFALCLAAGAAGQAKPTVGQYYMTKAKPGSEQAYEAGRKRHMEFHRKSGDTFPWLTWQVVVGQEAGSYLIGSGGHQWKDFDGREAFDAKDDADIAAHVAAFTESSRNTMWMFRPELSLSDESGAPSKYLAVMEFLVKPEGVGSFTESIMKINEGLKKTNSATKRSRWYSLVSGDDGPRFALVQERNSWADFDAGPKSLMDLMVDAFGKDEAAKLMSTVQMSYWHSKSYVLQYRPELSYIPGNM